MTRERYLVKSYGDNLEAARVGLAAFVEKLEPGELGMLVVPRLSDARSSMLGDILGAEETRVFLRDREISLEDGKRLGICSDATLKNNRYAAAYLAYWSSPSVIEDIENLSRWRYAIHVTHLREDSCHWDANDQVRVLYSDEES